MNAVSRIRFADVIALQGSPILGAMASTEAFTPRAAITFLLLLVGNSCLVAHVFLLNDLRDPNQADAIGIGGLCVILLASSILILGSLGCATLVLATAIAVLSSLYSGPLFHGKGVPIFSSMLHVLGGILHFLLGYTLFAAIDGRGVAIACFFALVFAAGHLTQETRDHDVDLANGIRTNAVAFGEQACFATGLVVFTIADLLLLVLAVRGTVPRMLSLVAVLYPVHAYWSFRIIRAGYDFESIRHFQIRYRLRYAITGVAMTIAFLRAL